MENELQFQRYLGCFLGLNDGLFRQKEAISIKNPTKFINFVQSDSLFSIKYYVEPQFTHFNKGISWAYFNLYRAFNRVITPKKLCEIFNKFKAGIGNYKFYFLQKFYDLEIESDKNSDRNQNLNKQIELIQNIRKKKPYFMGLVTSFIIFSNEIDFLDFPDLPEILRKLTILLLKTDFFSIFWVGFIEMLLKILAFFILFGNNLAEYSKRIESVEQKLIKKARNYRLNYEIFSINEIF